jgi:hypothetical protein
LCVFFVAINPHYVILFSSEQRPIERKGNMKYSLKRKPKQSEVKHLVNALGFELNDSYVIIPEEYSGVVRMYKEDGLI